MNPYEHRQKLIMAQSSQKDAVAIVRTKYLYNKGIEGDIKAPITNEGLIEEVIKVREVLLADLEEKHLK